MKVSVLGTDYEIIKKKYGDDKDFERRGISGYCDSELKRVVICSMATYPGFEHYGREKLDIVESETLRHEIVHAFLNESGLTANSFIPKDGWAYNEEMVDWIAIQGPKIYAAWQEAGAV